jgi:nitrate/TMAO reductase-like tetraheme cytochrome c subunit
MVEQTENQKPESKNTKTKKSKKQIWTIIGIVVLFLVVAGGATGGYLIHQSNTNPEFCATCHIMDRNVTSYLTSNHMDSVHAQANVECKDCHNYPLSSEIKSGIDYVTGNYTVDDQGDLLPVTYDNEMCLKCHISYDHVALSTDYLYRNPHNNHNGDLDCKTCHVSHGDQIDYCSTCHDNGGQRMVEDQTAREEKLK